MRGRSRAEKSTSLRSSSLRPEVFPETGESSSYMWVLVCRQIRPSAKGEAAVVVASVTRISPAPDLVEELLEVVQVEFILQAGAPRLQEDGKIGIGQDRIHELLRPEPVQPEGEAPLEIRPRQEQRPAGVFPEPRPEEPARLQRLPEQPLDVLRGDERQELPCGKFVGQHQQDAVVVHEDFEVIVVFLLPGRLQGQAERPVDPAAPEGVEDDLLPVRGVQGIVEVLDQEVPAVGEIRPRRLPLPLQMADQLVRRRFVQEIVPAELLLQGRGVEAAVERLRERAGSSPKSENPGSCSSARQKGKMPGFRIDRDHLHVVVGHLPDPPDLRAQGEGVADPAAPRRTPRRARRSWLCVSSTRRS